LQKQRKKVNENTRTNENENAFIVQVALAVYNRFVFGCAVEAKHKKKETKRESFTFRLLLVRLQFNKSRKKAVNCTMWVKSKVIFPKYVNAGRSQHARCHLLFLSHASCLTDSSQESPIITQHDRVAARKFTDTQTTQTKRKSF